MPPVSYASLDVNKVDLGPCRLTFNSVDLGGSLGNVTVAFKYDKAELKMDQLGTTPIDRRVSGMSVEISTELAQVQDMDKIKAAFPNLQVLTSGVNKSARFFSQVGSSDYALAQALVLHPLNKIDADKSGDWTFYKATATEESEIVFSPTDQKKLKVTWRVYPDFGSSDYRMFLIGDPAIGLVAATAAAAVAGSNTGNGTVGSITAYNGYTKTETITLLCVGIPSANNANFSVTGSVSGPLGIAKNGIAFVSNQISFTIADGTIDFIIGDSFTIATTASNTV